MLIKCFKKLSFRNSPFSSLSPAQSPGDLALPPEQPPPLGDPRSRSFRRGSQSPWQSCPGLLQAGACPGARPRPRRVFPWRQRTGPRREADGRVLVSAVQSSSLPLHLAWVFHLKQQWLLSYSVNRGTCTLPCF